MSLTYAQVLLELPVDTLLREWIEGQGIALPSDFAWTDDPETSHALLEAVDAAAPAQRDPIVALLQRLPDLQGEQGQMAIEQALDGDTATLEALAQCHSERHRALWLALKQPDLFEKATEQLWYVQRAHNARFMYLGLHQPVRRDAAALSAFETAISRFYQQQRRCGEIVTAHVLDPGRGTCLVIAHARDLPQTGVEFQGNALTRRIGTPGIPMALEYAPVTGVVSTLISGGESYRRQLISAFAEHLLDQPTFDIRRLRRLPLDLDQLRHGIQMPDALSDGFSAVRLRAITLTTPDEALRMTFTATRKSQRECVTQLIAHHLSRDNPLRRHGLVQAATIALHYPPGTPGRRVINVELTRQGRVNLHQFDEALRRQLEDYLRKAGILSPGFTLAMHEVNPSERPDLLDDPLQLQ